MRDKRFADVTGGLSRTCGKCCDAVVLKTGERLDNDPSGARYGCFLPDLTGLARRLPAPTSRPWIYPRARRRSRPPGLRRYEGSGIRISAPSRLPKDTMPLNLTSRVCFSAGGAALGEWARRSPEKRKDTFIVTKDHPKKGPEQLLEQIGFG